MVQEAVPAAAPLVVKEASIPTPAGSAPAYSKPAQNGNGASAHPKVDDDSESDGEDVWDTLLEVAEEDGGYTEGTLCARTVKVESP